MLSSVLRNEWNDDIIDDFSGCLIICQEY